DGLVETPTVNVGDRFTTSVLGVMDYGFGNFKLEITAPLTPIPGGLAPEVSLPAGPNQLAIATFNVENLDPGDGAPQFAALASAVVNNLRSPDLIAVEERQDNSR